MTAAIAAATVVAVAGKPVAPGCRDLVGHPRLLEPVLAFARDAGIHIEVPHDNPTTGPLPTAAHCDTKGKGETMTDQPERGAAIVVRDLTKSYPIAGKAGTPPEGGRKGKRGARMRKHVLDGVSFTVPTGAIVSFLGHNGAGKTTLIRILSTLITADSGEVSIFSRDVKEDPAGVRADIATTGQFAAIDENLTGRENLEFFGRLRGLDRAAAAARATELLAQFSLADSASTLASAYSGGMRRRLDIAASLCVVPRLLFLDEPTTGLDPVSREELWGFIRQLRDDGMTLVLTTQYLEEAEALADHVHLLKDRRIVASGTPEELRRDFGSHVLRVSFATAAEAEAFARCLGGTCLDGARVAGKSVSLDVDPGPRVLEAVAQAMEASEASPDSLSVSPPTLNEVFISMNAGGAAR